MPYAILRVAKLKTKPQALAATTHNYRQHQVPNADQEAPHPNREYLNTDQVDYWTLAEQRIKDAGVKRVRSDSVRAMEVIMTGSPEAFIRGADGRAADYSKSKWAQDNLHFLQNRFGKANVVSFTLHQDETTPHVHAVVIPITEDSRLSADALFNPNSLRQLQTDYAQVMEPYGMSRGVEHSQAKHQPMSRLYGAHLAASQQVEKLAQPQVAVAIELRDPPVLVGRDEWKRQEQARINAEVQRQVAEGNARLQQVATVAVANTTAREQAQVLRKQLHTSETVKQELSNQLAKLETANDRYDVVAVRVAQGDANALQELGQHGAAVREQSRLDLERVMVKALQQPVRDAEHFDKRIEAQGFAVTKNAEGKRTFTDPLTTAAFTSDELRPNGQPVRPQLQAAIERTIRQQERRRDDGGLSM